MGQVAGELFRLLCNTLMPQQVLARPEWRSRLADVDRRGLTPPIWENHLRESPVRGMIESVHPVLMARDVATAVRFYAALGFDTVFQDDPANPTYAAVRRDGVELHLQWADPGQWAHPVDRPAYRFHVRDIDVLYAEFRGAAGAIAGVGAPAETPWGTREFHVRDPGGNVLQFYRMLRAGDPPRA